MRMHMQPRRGKRPRSQPTPQDQQKENSANLYKKILASGNHRQHFEDRQHA